tara:strand:+ start:19684 stop:20808 length:1125 start_codon:yes stop_codon:yes gene_type:complete
MPDYPESGEKTSSLSINKVHASVAQEANAMDVDNVSRGALGPDCLNDSVIYCARNFSMNERVDHLQGATIDQHIEFPETVYGPYWGVTPPGSDPLINDHSSTFHREERRRWAKINTHCSSRQLVDADPSTITSGHDTDDYLGIGDYASSRSYRSDFGSTLLNIPNNGNGYSLFYQTDINIAHSLDNNIAISPSKFKRWLGGHRFWTGVVYLLRPSIKSERVLCWSPDHMVGASACEVTTGTEAKRGQLGTAHLGITHSYTDVIKVNNDFIKRLCDAQGINFELRKMALDGTSYFGWMVVGGLDRWDYIVPGSASSGLSDAVGAYVDEVGGVVLEMSYGLGQLVQTNGGSTNIIAFKDPDSGSVLETTSSLIQYQ